jgi:hypothetical protein
MLAFAIAYLFHAWHIPMDPWTAEETVNARTMPLVYGALLCCTLLASIGSATRVPGAVPAGRLLRVAGIVGITLLFLFSLQFFNLWLAIAGLLATLAFWLGERRMLPVLALATLVPLMGFLGIEVLLDLHLPT